MRGKRGTHTNRRTNRAIATLVAGLVVATGLTALAPTVAAGTCSGPVNLGGHGEDHPFHICIEDRPERIPAVRLKFNCSPWPNCVLPPPTPSTPPQPVVPGAPPQPGTPPEPSDYSTPPDPGLPGNDNCIIGDVCHPSAAELQRYIAAAVAAEQAWADATAGTAQEDADNFRRYAGNEYQKFICWPLCPQPDYVDYAQGEATVLQDWVVHVVTSVGTEPDEIVVNVVDERDSHVDVNVAEWLANEACEAVKGEDADPEDCEDDIREILKMIEDEAERIINNVLSNLPDGVVIPGWDNSGGEPIPGLVIQFGDQAYFVPLVEEL